MLCNQKVLLLLLAACSAANTHGARVLKSAKSPKSAKSGKKGKKKTEAPSMPPSTAPSTVPSTAPITICGPVESYPLTPDDISVPFEVYNSLDVCPPSFVNAGGNEEQEWLAIEQDVPQLEFNAGFLRGCFSPVCPGPFPSHLRLYLCGYDVLLDLYDETGANWDYIPSGSNDLSETTSGGCATYADPNGYGFTISFSDAC